MASSCKFSIGAPNPIQDAIIKSTIEQLDKRSGYTGRHLVAQFEVTQALPNALANILEGETNTFDGTVTPVEIDVVSSAAGDTDKVIHVVGIDENDEIVDESISLDGTDATTAVTTITKWKRIIGVWLPVACAGTITLSEVGGAVNQYAAIVIADLFSITSRMWCPDGWSLIIVSCVPLQTIVEAAAPLLSDGMNVGVNVNGTVQSRTVLPEKIGEDFCQPQPFNQPHDDDGYICLQHSQLDTDATACTATQNVLYLLYETP